MKQKQQQTRQEEKAKGNTSNKQKQENNKKENANVWKTVISSPVDSLLLFVKRINNPSSSQ